MENLNEICKEKRTGRGLVFITNVDSKDVGTMLAELKVECYNCYNYIRYIKSFNRR